MLTTAKMPLKLASGPCSQHDFNPLELLSIFDPSQQVSVIDRPQNVNLSSYLQQVSGKLGAGYRLTLRQTDVTPARLDHDMRLPAAPGKEALLEDMSMLAGLYADLMDCPKIGIRLEVLTSAMCPKFHIDRTGIRLLCTYLGPGTEWLDEAFCNRSVLTSAYPTAEAFHQALILHPQGMRQAPQQALVLLKGSLWQGNQHAGGIHRLPAILAAGTRVVLALDAIW